MRAHPGAHCFVLIRFLFLMKSPHSTIFLKRNPVKRISLCLLYRKSSTLSIIFHNLVITKIIISIIKTSKDDYDIIKTICQKLNSLLSHSLKMHSRRIYRPR